MNKCDNEFKKVRNVNGYTNVATLPDGTLFYVYNGGWTGYVTTENEDKVCYAGVNVNNPTEEYVNRIIINDGYDLMIDIKGKRRFENFEYCDVIKKCIQDCFDCGSAEYKIGKDSVGDPVVWVSAEWVEYDATHDVVRLYHHYTDTGRVAYSISIMETKTVKKKRMV